MNGVFQHHLQGRSASGCRREACAEARLQACPSTQRRPVAWRARPCCRTPCRPAALHSSRLQIWRGIIQAVTAMLSAAGVGTRLCMCGLRCKYHTGGGGGSGGRSARDSAGRKHAQPGGEAWSWRREGPARDTGALNKAKTVETSSREAHRQAAAAGGRLPAYYGKRSRAAAARGRAAAPSWSVHPEPAHSFRPHGSRQRARAAGSWTYARNRP